MSNKIKFTLSFDPAIRINVGDAVSFDHQGNATIGVDPATASGSIGVVTSVCHDQILDNIEITLMNSVGWFGIPDRICRFCKVREFQHVVRGESIMNHPFFHNNLEYLEWEVAKRV